MSRLKAPAIALVAVLAVAGVATAAPKKKAKKVRVSAGVTLAFKAGSGPSDPYANSRFAGQVKPKGKRPARAKRVCRAGRTVVLRSGGKRVARTKTNRKGRFAIPAGRIVARDPYAAPRRFKAVVAGKRKGKIVCKKASSRAVVAP